MVTEKSGGSRIGAAIEFGKADENPDWPGNYKYWNPDWQTVIYGNLGKILAAGFDGVYLDLIDAFEIFEQ